MLLGLMLCGNVHSQNIFKGGTGDGYATAQVFQLPNMPGIFNGGGSDGNAVSMFEQPTAGPGIYNGGGADGYASAQFDLPATAIGIFSGGAGDGWSSSEGSNVLVDLFCSALLEGPYAPGQQLMNDGLRSAGVLPLSEPYTALGYPQFAGGGGETTNTMLLAITGSTAIVDWVRLELRDATNPAIVVATCQALVRRDGSIVNGSGSSLLRFGVPIGGSYYLVVRHRNHIGCMTAAPILFSGVVPSIGFSGTSTVTYGTDARKVSGTASLLRTGDVSGDHRLQYTGGGNDRDLILLKVGGTSPNNIAMGYWREDVNLDGIVKYTGTGNDRDPILVNVGSTLPNSVRLEQVP